MFKYLYFLDKKHLFWFISHLMVAPLKYGTFMQVGNSLAQIQFNLDTLHLLENPWHAWQLNITLLVTMYAIHHQESWLHVLLLHHDYHDSHLHGGFCWFCWAAFLCQQVIHFLWYISQAFRKINTRKLFAKKI